MMKLILRYLSIIFIAAGSAYNVFSQIDGSLVSQSDFRTTMEILLVDNTMLQRELIINIIDNRSGNDEAIENLRKKQIDIGNALRPYYRDEITNQLTKLLDGHVTASIEFFKAVKNEDANDLETAKQKWYTNADSILMYLDGSAPFVSSNEMTQAVHELLSATIDEALAHLKKNSTAETTAYEKVHGQIIIIADMFADAVIKQFPEKFI